MNCCIICLGTNYERNKYLQSAHNYLESEFSDIVYANAEETQPYHFKSGALFTNQVAMFHTTLSQDSVKEKLKSIEAICGRKQEDKAKEIVRIDIDMIIFNDHVVKRNDYKLEYVQRGIGQLMCHTAAVRN